MSWYEWRPYVSVAERRRKAQAKLKTLKKKGETIAPVTIDGRTIAKSFWGKSWCDNLERYSDFENRLPRGRTYVRNGSVVDLQIGKGEVVARVAGSELYTIKIAITPVKKPHWTSICRDCAGTIDSLVELLQGRLAKGVMDRVCREGDGLFPSLKEIKLSCSCPDWADMCKHVAAALYGVGARLDESPRLLFVLRGVDETELLASAGQDLALAGSAPRAAKVLDDGDVAALFGLEMAEPANSDTPAAAKPKRQPERPSKDGKDAKPKDKAALKGSKAPKASATAKQSKTPADKKARAAKDTLLTATQRKPEQVIPPIAVPKGRAQRRPQRAA
jgi:uncharacterized Zn finger protein